MREHGFFDYTLDSARKASSLIVEGTVIATNGLLTKEGNNIVTIVRMQVENVFKGTIGGDCDIQLHGGKITYPNGDTAEITSIIRPK